MGRGLNTGLFNLRKDFTYNYSQWIEGWLAHCKPLSVKMTVFKSVESFLRVTGRFANVLFANFLNRFANVLC